MERIFRLLLLSLLMTCLTACTTRSTPAPIRETAIATSLPGKHRVRAGETLFSIAKGYGLSVSSVAKRNHLRTPYVLAVGELLSLPRASEHHTQVRKKAVVHRSQLKPSRAKFSRKILAHHKTQRPSAIKHKSNLRQKAIAKLRSPNKWYWPTQGKLVKRFASSNKGIDIAGRLGQAVNSTAAGVVMYSGNGLRGYGNLLIIKHDKRTLSAYAHNQKLLVKEGEPVKAGQKIAEMGSSGARQVMLHFEIRRDGKPIDPLKVLVKV